MFEPEKKRCPWCPNPKTCTGCSLSGEDPENYILVPQAQVTEKLRKARRRWLAIVFVLLGMLLASLFALAWLLMLYVLLKTETSTLEPWMPPP